MSTGRFSSFVVAPWMDDMEAIAKWLSVVSSDPFATSVPYTAEIVGEHLLRQPSTWVRSSAGVLTLSAVVRFPGLPAGAHVAGVACWDAQYNGNLLFADLLDVPVDYPSGGTFTLPAGEYVVGVDVPGA